MTSGPIDTDAIRIEGKGYVPARELEHARTCVEKIIGHISGPVLSAKALLTDVPNNSIDHRARAEATIHLKHDVVRAHTHASTMRQAIDDLETKMRRQLDHRSDRQRHKPTSRPAEPGEWRHGNLPADRPPYYDRPIDDRELVRHKTFATPVASVEEARWDMELLDYDFFLFCDEATGEDATLTTEADEVLRLADAPDIDVPGAVEWLNTTGRDFVFFRDTETDRGAVAYRRYDGHYGLLTPR